MKHLIIHTKGSPPVHLSDDDDKDIEEYSIALCSLFKVNSIAILHTSSGSAIIRPSALEKILIENSSTKEPTDQKQSNDSPQSNNQEDEYVLTDEN